MFERPFMLGQVPIAPGTGFTGPFGIYSGPSYYAANPSGEPYRSEEITSPEHYNEEYHCYRAPDGTYVSIPFGQAAAYKAVGYEAADVANCSGRSMGRSRRLGQASAPASAPTPASPAPAAAPQEDSRLFWPPLPLQYPYAWNAPSAAPTKLICKQKTVNDEVVLECEPEVPPPVTYPPIQLFRPIWY